MRFSRRREGHFIIVISLGIFLVERNLLLDYFVFYFDAWDDPRVGSSFDHTSPVVRSMYN